MVSIRFSLSIAVLAIAPLWACGSEVADDPHSEPPSAPDAPASPEQPGADQESPPDPRPRAVLAERQPHGGAIPGPDGGDGGPDGESLDGFHVLVSAGQSNTHFGLGTIPSDFVAHPRVFQLQRHGDKNLQIGPGKEPFEHWTSNNSNIGHAKTFAERYVETLAPDQKVLVVPGGCAGSGLGTGVWMPGGAFFEDLVWRVQHVLWNHPDSKLVAVLWHQGEDDVFNPDYQQDLIEMIEQMRLRFGGGSDEYATLPFLLGGFSDAWVSTNWQHQVTEDLIAEIPWLVPHTAFVNSDGLGHNHPPGYPQDVIHINAAGQREFGHRYFERLDDAIGNAF